MIRFLADENFNNDIIRGVRRRAPGIDIVRVQDVGLRQADDPHVLAWAADENRIVLTHDVSTMTAFAYKRMVDGLAMPGVLEIKRSVLLGQVIEDIILIAECSEPDEWANQVHYLPLR